MYSLVFQLDHLYDELQTCLCVLAQHKKKAINIVIRFRFTWVLG